LTTAQIEELARRASAGEPKSTLAWEFNSRETVCQYLCAAAETAAST